MASENDEGAATQVPLTEPSPTDSALAPPSDVTRGKGRKFSGRIMEVRDRRGRLQAAIPYVPGGFAWLILFLNVFLPGTGTFLMGLAALCGARTNSKKPNKCVDCLLNLATGLLQALTALIIVGWVWSIYWGMHAVTQANETHRRPPPPEGDKDTHIYNPPKD